MNPGRTVPLLVYLLLHRDQPLKRQFLAQTLWPDVDDESALGGLRRNLFRIEKSLPPFKGRWLHSDGVSVQWNAASPAIVDTDEFLAACEGEESLEAAVALYTGDLAEGLYDDWILGARERYRSEYLSALLRLVNRSRRDLEHGKAIVFSQWLLTADPLREDVLRQLMLSRYDSGDAAGALRDYHAFTARLRAELDVLPMPETQVTRDLILRGIEKGSTLSERRQAAASPQVDRAILPLVGRNAEMAEARNYWDRAARGSGNLLLVSGEAGIGKSRIARELRLIAESQGARVLQGSTASPESTPYQSIVDAFRSALPIVATVDLKPAARSAFSLLVPELGEAPALVSKELDSEAARLALLDAIALMLAGLAKPRPVLFIMEDLHWAGGATLSAIEYLARRVARKPVLLLATYRDEEAASNLRAMRRTLQQLGLCGHLAPAPLRADAIADLARHCGLASESAQRIASEVYARTEGNPLFVTEALRQFSDVGSMPDSGLHSLIAGRVARLTEDARHLLEVAAIIGGAFTVELLRDGVAWPEARVLANLNDLLDHRLVRESGAEHRYDFVFSHQLVQETVYRSIPVAVAKRRHHRIAGILEREAPDEDAAAAIATHWMHAGEAHRAAPQYLVAARAARRLSALDEALDLATRGLAAAQDLRLRCELYELQIELLQLTRAQPAQRAAIDAYLNLAAELDDSKHQTRALLYAVEYERAAGAIEAEDRVIDRLYDVTRIASDPALEVEALLADATREGNRSKYERAEQLLKNALALCAQSGLRDLELRTLGGLLDVALDLDRVEDTAVLLARAEAITTAKDSAARLLILWRAARSAQLSRRDQECFDRADEYLQLARSIGDRQAEAQALRMKALAASRTSRFMESEEGFASASALFEEIGDARGQAYSLHEHATVIGTLGMYDESEALFGRALEIFEKLEWPRGRAFCLFNLSATCIGAGRYEEALEFARRAIEIADTFPGPSAKATALRNVATAQSWLGRSSQALESIEQAIALQRTIGDTGDLPLFLSEGARIAALARDPRATSYCEEALRLYRNASAGVLSVTEVLWGCAVSMHLCGSASRARDVIAEAHELVQRDGVAIGDEPVRSRWLASAPVRDILAAYERNEWPRVESHG